MGLGSMSGDDDESEGHCGDEMTRGWDGKSYLAQGHDWNGKV